jgi:hypothetical protein
MSNLYSFGHSPSPTDIALPSSSPLTIFCTAVRFSAVITINWIIQPFLQREGQHKGVTKLHEIIFAIAGREFRVSYDLGTYTWLHYLGGTIIFQAESFSFIVIGGVG